MTDRELLELAAKAVGFNYNPTIYQGGSLWGCFNSDKAQTTYAWNPITDDGDALRLVVKLRINLEHMQTLGGKPFGINAWPIGRGDCGVSDDDLYASDAEAATRRAIVRAAAEIGKEMK